MAGTVWKVFAQSLGNTTHFSSSKTVAHVLEMPEIESATYDWVSKDFAATWRSIDHSSHYEIEIRAMRGDGAVLIRVEKVEPTATPSETLTMNMGTDHHGWNSFFFLVQLSSITVVVRAIGSELYLSGPSSEPCIIPESRIGSPANVKVQASGRVVTVTWACVSDAISYSVDIFLDGVPVNRDEVSGNDTMYEVHDSLLIEKVHFPYKHHIKASVTALSSPPSHPSLPAEAEIDMVFEFNGSLSEEWGSPIGQRFDDVASRSTDIVGIKAIWIHHGKTIDSLQAEYMLEDGSSFVADKHGGIGGCESYIEFSDGEVITEIHGSANGAGVHQLTFITSVTGGARKEYYGPYGTTGSITFSVKSKIIGFYGKCGDILDAIGFYCR